jgi:hypothetical protein
VVKIPRAKRPRGAVPQFSSPRGLGPSDGRDAKKADVPRPCACGCGELTRCHFVSGHSATYMSQLVKQALAGNQAALAELEQRNWMNAYFASKRKAERKPKRKRKLPNAGDLLNEIDAEATRRREERFARGEMTASERDEQARRQEVTRREAARRLPPPRTPNQYYYKGTWVLG